MKMNIDIHHLEVFCTCAELGSFSEAALCLGIKQSTISTHIRTVESELGVPLFDRRKNRIHLTPAGEVLYRMGLKVITARTEAIAAVNTFLNRIEGSVSLGGSTTPAAYILPDIISGFIKVHPKVTVHLITGNTASILRDVCLEKVELGAVGSMPDEEQFASCILGDDELLLTYSPIHFPEISENLTLAQAREFPFIMREEGSGTRRLIERVFSQKNISQSELKVVAHMGSIEAVKRAAVAGMGVCLIPGAALKCELAASLLKAVPLRNARFTRNFYLVRLRSKTLSPVAQALWNFVLESRREVTRM
ncbi:MAG: LysR family transcriptional regulator [bacterium]